ncbi:MAG: hypothetical protein ACRDRG_18975 [Pseudonocardiaceae bacterium]
MTEIHSGKPVSEYIVTVIKVSYLVLRSVPSEVGDTLVAAATRLLRGGGKR